MTSMRRERNDWRRRLWARATGGADAEVNLALAALLFAADQDRTLDLSAEVAKLDALATGARRTVILDDGPEVALLTLGEYLHGEQGFGGSDRAYASPDGSFLHAALRERTGLPITLSAIYLEVGWRLGLPLAGVALPGHFIVKYEVGGGSGDVYSDPYDGGRVLTEEGVREMIRERSGGTFELPDRFLEAAQRKAILYRMLNNLKALYLRSQQPRQALWATDRMLILQPEGGQDLRDRGLLAYAVGEYDRARSDLLSYLMTDPAPPDAPAIREQIPLATRRAGMLN